MVGRFGYKRQNRSIHVSPRLTALKHSHKLNMKAFVCLVVLALVAYTAAEEDLAARIAKLELTLSDLVSGIIPAGKRILIFFLCCMEF